MADIQIKRIPRIDVKAEGSLVGTEPGINFIEGSGIALTVTDDPSNAEVDVTVAASAPALYYDTTGTTPKVSKAGQFIVTPVNFALEAQYLGATTLSIKDDAVAIAADLYGQGFATVDARDCAALRVLKVQISNLGSLLVSGSTQLRMLHTSEGEALESVDISGLVNLINVNLFGEALTESAVDDILADLDTAGLSDGNVDLSGGTNSAPSAAGLTSKSNLEGKGWTVTVNP